MARYIGIDVSYHNGDINWGEVAGQIDFAIIRAGYGKNNIDKKAIKNIEGCKNNNIPFGLYWFSYALNAEMAKAEANYICDLADNYHPTYPICYDWEYDSDTWANANGVDITNDTRLQLARSFLDRVVERGYQPMLYTNIDYLTKGFAELCSKYPIWLAEWQVGNPSNNYDIWQYTSSGTLSGIKTKVDMNVSKTDYHKATENKMGFLNKFVWGKYNTVANEIIDGKYGNGDERKKKLKEKGYDAELAQMLVNYLLK